MSSKLPRYVPPSPFTPFLRRFTDERARDLSETNALYNEVSATHLSSLWANPQAIAHVNTLIAERVGEAVDLPRSSTLLKALDRCQQEILALETTIFTFPEIDLKTAALSLKEHVDLRRYLSAKQHFHANDERVANLLMDTLAGLFEAIVSALPDIADTTEETPSLTVPVVCLLRRPGDLIARLIATICQRESAEAGLFSTLQDRLYKNVCLASGVSPADEKPRKPLIEADSSDLPPVELVKAYLRETPFLELFLCPIPFSIPAKTRFEHQWIVAPPGAGKSTLLQYLISRDLELVAADQASIVVMESNRDLIKAIEGLKAFAPGEVLDGKLVVIDAEDVEWPVALNLFDVGIGEMHSYSPAEHEGFRNAVLALYDYIFSALLSAEMTSRQNTLFHFTIELLLTIPSATIDTLIDLMQPGGLAKFKEHLSKLDSDAQRFFELKFNSKEFDRTKEQVVDRLFAVKRIRTLSRMFAAPRSKFDFFTEMGAAKVILINVPQSLLQEDGVEIVGRFFISMILLAAHKRQLLPKGQRLPCFVYIDECQDFIKRDPKIPVILDQARKLNVGLVLAHQRLQQMQPHVLDALYGATAIKFASKISDAAAHALARDMRTTPDFILNQPQYHFAAYVRGTTNAALSVGISATDLNGAPRMTAHEHAEVRRRIRERYAVNPAASVIARIDVEKPSSKGPKEPVTGDSVAARDLGGDDWRS
ncbi:ATP-binding protein [Bradyrhizobium barranii subsp. apii]|uniref:ATP-binding protein n=1 Tax=Bradyrhizobium barranii TaxID=2992140 RepID=UPI001AA13E99|nr:ATP-binding protein [Bradyrhizobium barranii]UPT96120.1 ATP-binding protein [Bradyrhizobium barranii subsp. apii]